MHISLQKLPKHKISVGFNKHFKNRLCILKRTIGSHTAFRIGSLCSLLLYLLIVKQLSAYRETYYSHCKEKKSEGSLFSPFCLLLAALKENANAHKQEGLATRPHVGGFSLTDLLPLPHRQAGQILNAYQIPVCVPHVTFLQNFPLMKYCGFFMFTCVNIWNPLAERQP